MDLTCGHNWTVTSPCPKCLGARLEAALRDIALITSELVDERERRERLEFALRRIVKHDHCGCESNADCMPDFEAIARDALDLTAEPKDAGGKEET